MLVITKCPLLNLDSSRVFTNSKSTTVRFLTIGIFGRSSEFDDLTDDNFRWDRIHQKCKLNRYGNFGKNTIIGINLLSWNKIQNSQLYRKLLEFIPRKLIPNLKWVNFLTQKKHSMVEMFDASGGQCSVKFVERCEHFPFNISEPMSVQKLQILNREEMILKEWQHSYQQIITLSTTVSQTQNFKGILDPSHFIFEINLGKRRIRHRTTLNNVIFNRFWVE